MTRHVFENDYKSFSHNSTQGIRSISTHAFANSIQINHSCNYKCDYLPWHLIKMTCNCINDYEVVCSYICNLYL
jgi:hypothetical protein